MHQTLKLLGLGLGVAAAIGLAAVIYVGARPRDAAILATAVLGLEYVIWWFPGFQLRLGHQVPSERAFDAENEARKTLAQIFGGLILLSGLFYSAQTLRLAQQQQIASRFSTAVQQLGATEGGKKNLRNAHWGYL